VPKRRAKGGGSEKPRGRKGRGSIFERGGRWVGVVELPADPETHKRRRAWVYGKSQAEVGRAMDDARAKGARGARIGGDENERLAAYLDRWLVDVRTKQKRRPLKPATLVSYASVVERHIAPGIGAIRIHDLTRKKVKAFYDRLNADGVGPRTVSKVHAVLHRALSSAAKDGLVVANPASIDEDVPTYEAPAREPLTPEQTICLLRAARGDRLEALYILAATTGARQGELFALRWTDVDLDRGMLAISRALHDADDRGKLAIGRPKTAASRRRFAIPALAIDALLLHRERELTAGRGRDRDLIFPAGNGEPLRRQNFLRRDFYPLLERAGVPRIHFHDLRHGAATALASMGTPVVVVAALLGHRDPVVTLRTYQHAFEGAAGDAAQRLGDAISKALKEPSVAK